MLIFSQLTYKSDLYFEKYESKEIFCFIFEDIDLTSISCYIIQPQPSTLLALDTNILFDLKNAQQFLYLWTKEFQQEKTADRLSKINKNIEEVLIESTFGKYAGSYPYGLCCQSYNNPRGLKCILLNYLPGRELESILKSYYHFSPNYKNFFIYVYLIKRIPDKNCFETARDFYKNLKEYFEKDRNTIVPKKTENLNLVFGTDAEENLAFYRNLLNSILEIVEYNTTVYDRIISISGSG